MAPLKWWPELTAEHRSIPRYCISCESYSETMTLLFFGGPAPSLTNRFGLWRSQLAFHFGCRESVRYRITSRAPRVRELLKRWWAL